MVNSVVKTSTVRAGSSTYSRFQRDFSKGVPSERNYHGSFLKGGVSGNCRVACPALAGRRSFFRLQPPQSGLLRIFPSLRKEGSFYCTIPTPPHTVLFTAAMACSSSELEACIRLMAIVAPSGERSEKYHFPSGVELRS